MKRVISLCLLLALLLPLLAVPVSAAAVSDVTITPYVDTNTWYDYVYQLLQYIAELIGITNETFIVFVEFFTTNFTDLISGMFRLFMTMYDYIYKVMMPVINSIDKGISVVVGQLDWLTEIVRDYIYDAVTSIYYECQQIYKLIDDFVISILGRISDDIVVIKANVTMIYSDFLKRLNQIVSSLQQLLKGDTNQSGEFVDKTEEIDKVGDEYLDVMEGVTKPPIEDMDTNIYWLGPGYQTLGAPLKNLLSSSVFLDVLVMAFTFAMVSYVLYGKR